MAGKPIRGTCTGCQQWIEGPNIFHYSPSTWAVYCFKCYKNEHYQNLIKIQEKDTPT